MSSIKLYFIRHWEHIKTWNDDFSSELCQDGKQEIEDISKKININNTNNISFIINNIRSFVTALLLNKQEIYDRKQLIDQLNNNSIKNIRILNWLNYWEVNKNSPMLLWLSNAVEKWKVLEYLVSKSDNDILFDERGKASTYNKIVRDVSKYLLRYKILYNNWEKLSNKEECTNNVLTRSFSPRAYIYGCFRAKITELKQWENKQKEYINWFDKNIVVDNDKFLWIILIKNKNNELVFELKDWFGELTFNINDLKNIVIEEDENRQWVYILPVDLNKKEILMLKYIDGFWALGWWLKKWETIYEWIKRELIEESNILDQVNMNNIMNHWVKNQYKFNKILPNNNEVQESHKYFILPIDMKNNNLTSKVENTVLTWIPLQLFFSWKFSKYDIYNDYIKENIQPVIEKII